MKRQLILLLAAGLSLCTIPTTTGRNAEETPDTLRTAPVRSFEFHFGTDLMSSYVCRGSYQAGPSFQPTFKASYAGFFLTAWGSIDFTGSQMREVDLTLGYQIDRFEIAITDYYIAPHPHIDGRFFDFGPKSAHSFEASVSWTISPRIPIGLWWGTMFAGADVDDNGRRNYSSYAEISYPFAVKKTIDLKTGVGFMPWSTENCFNTRGFAVTNIYLHAAKQWTFRGNLRLGILARLICNPYREQLNFVGGISFHI